MTKIKDKVLLLLGAIGAAVAFLIPLVEVKPNRIAAGQKIKTLEYLGIWGMLIIVGWVILMALSLYGNKERGKFVTLTGIVWGILLVCLIPSKAGEMSILGENFRISLASGFYIQVFCIYIILSSYIHGSGWKLWKTLALGLVLILLLAWGVSLGYFDDLSLIKEYRAREVQFYTNLRIHAILSTASVFTGAIVAVPLGYLAYAKKKLEGKIMVPLSIIETIPSLSLFGILLVPLSGLGRLGLFRAIGVSGIGWAPAYVALSLYTLLPIGRNTLTGFQSINKDVVEAAKGMGMSKGKILRSIEVPLAFPVIFAGIRIAFIQTIGGAVLAGLVGGGGMGSFVFLGLAEASPDLILLGVIPIVFLTVILDYSLKAVENFARRSLYD